VSLPVVIVPGVTEPAIASRMSASPYDFPLRDRFSIGVDAVALLVAVLPYTHYKNLVSDFRPETRVKLLTSTTVEKLSPA
jgi:hypothetical protein